MPPKSSSCGNPLFLQWAEELRDAAREKGTKMYDVWARACRSLAACPIPYDRPRELTCLANIGPKTASILETKWKKHCEENGISVATTPQKINTLNATMSGDETDAGPPKPPKKRKAAAEPKRYIPKPGSGGYGILLALVLAIDKPEEDTQVYLTKNDIIRAAQTYCDSSYDVSSQGTYHNAWSNMKSLISKGYVYVTGNPHKYCLTEEGYEVACAIRNMRPEFSHMDIAPFFKDVTASSIRPAISQLPLATSKRIPSPTGSSLSPAIPNGDSPGKTSVFGERFQFWYVDGVGARVGSMQAAAVRLDPDEFVSTRRIEFLHGQRDHGFVSQLRMVDMNSVKRFGAPAATFYAYIPEAGAPPQCSGFAINPAPSLADNGGPVVNMVDDFVAMPTDIVSKAQYPPVADASASATFKRTASVPSAIPATKSNGGVKSFARTQSEILAGPMSKARTGPRLSSHVPTPSPLAPHNGDSDRTLPNFDVTDAIVFPANDYEVIMILDNREKESKSATGREKIEEFLLQKGIKVEVRPLHLGDVAWIARRTDGFGGEDDECVLDYICERKRLDDLCSSIRDGRYTEQSFRLQNSCIRNVFYVVEDFATTALMEYNGLAIMTAKSQIQVHNRFYLKETTKLSDSIDFLVSLTKSIESVLKGKSLHVIPTRYLSRSTYSGLQRQLRTTCPEKSFLTSFEAYQDLNDKTASKTLKEQFARMLMCVKGMSPERAAAILEVFETPRDLWEAMKVRAAEEAAEATQPVDGSTTKKKAKKGGADLFFADRVQGEGRRKIGDALSRELWKAFMGGPQASTDHNSSA